MENKVYRLDCEYEDRKAKDQPNEFVRWLGIRNSGGVREMMTLQRSGGVADIGVLVVVSRHVAGSGYNPWEDVVDRNTGRIWYWGDAKAHRTKNRDDFLGNQRLLQVWVAINEGRFRDVPPILHFSKHAVGKVTFNGLCVLNKLEEAWFEDAGVRVRNYRALLDILPVHEVPVAWLNARRRGVARVPIVASDGTSPSVVATASMSADGIGGGMSWGAPAAWRAYAQSGTYTRLTSYASRIRSRVGQLPEPGSEQWARLQKLCDVAPESFEKLIVGMFNKLEVAHKITGTRHVRDGGFDFFGSFFLPPPLSYNVALKGEVKRYAPTGGVGPKDVARLVARLQRGEHGVFVTTSYYTRQCQEEVLADRYPAELISGGQLVGMMSQLGMSP